jgi:hypothetical protein
MYSKDLPDVTNVYCFAARSCYFRCLLCKITRQLDVYRGCAAFVIYYAVETSASLPMVPERPEHFDEPRILRSTRLMESVIEIAFHDGYDNHSYFDRVLDGLQECDHVISQDREKYTTVGR